MEDVESRFMHFLQPIRDLTKNWEVDVASQLGEYLEELDQICISFDGGKTTMNFIEAALVIQGSACIYSKKVEYLYSLVYQALDFISHKKREKPLASAGEDGAEAEVSSGPMAEEEKFLSLDDIQDTSGANMDLKGDQQRSVVSIVPLTPMALVPAEEGEKKEKPLFSQKGELLASQKDFRMNTCTPHANGAFMLELAGISPTQCLPGRHHELHCGSSIGLRSLAPAAGSTPSNACAGEMPILALDFSDKGDAAMLVCDDEPDADLPLDDPGGSPSTPCTRMEHTAQQMSIPQRKGYMLRERAPVPEASAHIKEMLDPWRSLDPFSACDDKPLKKGRPFMVPRGLDDLPGIKRKRRLSTKLQEFTTWFLATEHDRADSQRSRRKGPTFADLEVLYWRQVKERLASQKKLKRRMLLAVPCEGPPFEEERNPLEEENLDHDSDEGGADDFLELEDPPLLEAPQEVSESMTGSCSASNLFSYEDLVRQNVELFIANSQKYTRETVLSRRIQDWEAIMGPQLEEQEAHSAFDIHNYGDRLISRLGRVGEWRSFASMVAGQPAFEVCRCMLASLQLANDYTVEIAQQPGLEKAVDTMALRLLTQEKAHERFQTYTAPSLAQQ